MKNRDLIARLGKLERELAELRAWQAGHSCAQPAQPAAWQWPWQKTGGGTLTPVCTCGTTIGPCMLHGGVTVTYTTPDNISTLTGTNVTASGSAWQASAATLYFNTGRAPLKQVWPRTNPPDDPDLGVPAIA